MQAETAPFDRLRLLVSEIMIVILSLSKDDGFAETTYRFRPDLNQLDGTGDCRGIVKAYLYIPRQAQDACLGVHDSHPEPVEG